MRRVALTTLTALLAAAVLVPAGALAPSRSALADDGPQVELRTTNETEMEAFLEKINEITGYPLVWNPQDKNIRAKKLRAVNLRGTKDEVFSQARGLLTFYELVFIPIGPDGREIYLVMDARATSSILKLKPRTVMLTDENLADYESQDGLFVTATIKVRHMTDLRSARNALTRIVTGQNIGNVTEVPASKAFVVTDFAPNVVAIYRLLKEMDQPADVSTEKTTAVLLEHADAAEVGKLLASHFPPPVVMRGNPQAPPAPKPPRINADARTNRILVTGTEAQVGQVLEALRLLDVPAQTSAQEAHLIEMKHGSSDYAAQSLTQLILSSPRLWRDGGDKESTPSVVSHSDTNSLLVSCTPAALSSIRALVAALDKPLKRAESGDADDGAPDDDHGHDHGDDGHEHGD